MRVTNVTYRHNDTFAQLIEGGDIERLELFVRGVAVELVFEQGYDWVEDVWIAKSQREVNCKASWKGLSHFSLT